MPTTTSTPAADRNPEIVVAASPALSPSRALGLQKTYSKTQKSLADMETGIAHYPDPILTEARWLLGYYLDSCLRSVVSLRATACKLKFEKSEAYFYNILNGYNFRGGAGDWKQGGGAWSEFLEFVAALRRHDQSTSRTGKLPFVQTPTYHCIADFITAHRATNAVCKFAGITGPTGGQKSECFKFYRTLNNHGAVVHVEAPANGRVTALQGKIARAYHVGNNKILRNREAVVLENVNDTRTIIIDNAQDLYIDGAGSNQPTFTWLRELQDDTGCTIILSFTTDFVDILKASRAKGYFEQFVGRMGGMESLLNLPDYAPESDLRAIAHSFDLDPGKSAMDWLVKWSRRPGRIRIVFDKLQKSRAFADLDGSKRITLAAMEEADTYVPPAIGDFNPEKEGA